MSVENDRDVALGKIGQQLRRMLQRREAEERRDRRVGGRVHGADAHFDFLLGQFDDRWRRGSAPDPCATRCACRRSCPAATTCLVISGCQLACSPISKKVAFKHLLVSALSDGHGVLRPGTVVEGQHHFLVAQEIVLLEMLEAEARAAGGVDFDYARKAHAARLVAGRDAARAAAAAAASGVPAASDWTCSAPAWSGRPRWRGARGFHVRCGGHRSRLSSAPPIPDPAVARVGGTASVPERVLSLDARRVSGAVVAARCPTAQLPSVAARRPRSAARPPKAARPRLTNTATPMITERIDPSHKFRRHSARSEGAIGERVNVSKHDHAERCSLWFPRRVTVDGTAHSSVHRPNWSFQLGSAPANGSAVADKRRARSLGRPHSPRLRQVWLIRAAGPQVAGGRSRQQTPHRRRVACAPDRWRATSPIAPSRRASWLAPWSILRRSRRPPGWCSRARCLWWLAQARGGKHAGQPTAAKFVVLLEWRRPETRSAADHDAAGGVGGRRARRQCDRRRLRRRRTDAALAVDCCRSGAGADAAEGEIGTGRRRRSIAKFAIGRKAPPILVAAAEKIEQNRRRHDRHPRGAHGEAAVLLPQPRLNPRRSIEAESRSAGQA